MTTSPWPNAYSLGASGSVSMASSRELDHWTAETVGMPKLLVDDRALGVEDARDDERHVEALARDARGDDVAVVAARAGRECVGPLDAGLDERVAVEHLAGQPAAVDALELLEDVGVAIDDGDRVALALELVREVPAHSAVPPDDDVHTSTPSSGMRPGRDPGARASHNPSTRNRARHSSDSADRGCPAWFRQLRSAQRSR